MSHYYFKIKDLNKTWEYVQSIKEQGNFIHKKRVILACYNHFGKYCEESQELMSSERKINLNNMTKILLGDINLKCKEFIQAKDIYSSTNNNLIDIHIRQIIVDFELNNHEKATKSALLLLKTRPNIHPILKMYIYTLLIVNYHENKQYSEIENIIPLFSSSLTKKNKFSLHHILLFLTMRNLPYAQQINQIYKEKLGDNFYNDYFILLCSPADYNKSLEEMIQESKKDHILIEKFVKKYHNQSNWFGENVDLVNSGRLSDISFYRWLPQKTVSGYFIPKPCPYNNYSKCMF